MERRQRLEQFMLRYPEVKRAAFGKLLNEGLCRDLTDIMNLCDTVRENLPERDAVVADDLAGIRGFLADAVTLTREMAKGLNPLQSDSCGFGRSIDTLAEKTSVLFNVRCRASGTRAIEVSDPDQALNLYRIAQEAIHNAIRHGKARNIEIALSGDAGTVRLSIADDGCGRAGMQGNPKGMGLNIMAYRARAMSGTLRIIDSPEGGVTVECSAPKL